MGNYVQLKDSTEENNHIYTDVHEDIRMFDEMHCYLYIAKIDRVHLKLKIWKKK